MTTLIRTEWLKMKKYNAFWWILGVTALSYPGINYIFYLGFENTISQPTQASQYAKFALGNPFEFPEVWHTVAYFSSWFVFIPAVLIIMFISNEYTFKTHRQNIIDGWSRSQFITSKLMDVLIISGIITLIYFIVCLVTGFSLSSGKGNPFTNVHYTGLFALQTFSQLSLAFLVGFLVRKAFLALGIFLFYFMILENLIVGTFDWYHSSAGHYLPLEVSDRLIPRPVFLKVLDAAGYQKLMDGIPLHIFLTLILCFITWFICYRINNKRDLK